MKSKIFSTRLQNLRKKFKKWKVEGCLIEDPTDLFYLTGLHFSVGTCLVTSKEAHLFVDGRYVEIAKQKSPVQATLTSKEALESAFKPLASIGFDARVMSVERLKSLKKLAKCSFKEIIRPLKEIRAIKDEAELKALKKSAQLLWKGFQAAKRHLKVGITEQEIAMEFEIFCRRHGAEKLAFDPIIAFGENSAFPHYRAGKRRLKKGDLVLFDIGVSVDEYHSDMTRTLFFGKPDPRLVFIESVVKKAHKRALELCKAGAKVADLDLAARQVVIDAGLKDLLAHSLGHGIGLETHEFPRLSYQGEDRDVILQEGMCVTIEPGLYLPGLGGIRYEDTVVVTKKGYSNFYA